jgi:hypothetical protein
MRAQGARASPGSPRIQTAIQADPRKADGAASFLKGDTYMRMKLYILYRLTAGHIN